MTEGPEGINCIEDCPAIGSCCRVFYVSHSGRRERLAEIVKERTPFGILASPLSSESLVVSCKICGDDGLCQDYENRPELCRVFEPGKDALCVLFCGPPGPGSLPVNFPGLAELRWKGKRDG